MGGSVAGPSAPFDPDRLVNFEIPEVRQQVSERDFIFYALSIGLGQDPMDCDQLAYLREGDGFRIVPSVAVVLGHPGFWLSDPRTGVDPKAVLHGEQEISLHAPLPPSGEIRGRTRVTGLVDKGPGKAALLHTEKTLTDGKGETVFATTRMTTFLRGYGGFGGTDEPAKPVTGTAATSPDVVVDLQTRPEQALYYRLNADPNPLHIDPAVAAAAGFPRPILHGLCTFGVICHALLRTLAGYDTGRMKNMALRFSAPVFPGETIRTEIWQDGSFRAGVVERGVTVASSGRVAIA